MLRLVLLALPLLATAAVVAWALAARQQRVGLDPAGSDAAGRNHREMARLLERIVADDLVRPMLPEAERARADDLLREYWGSPPEGPT